MATPTLTDSPSAIGSFTSEAFGRALAAHRGAPAWWLDAKRAAYERFAGMPLPRRTDENWRFSTISSLNLDGYALPEAAGAGWRIPQLDFESAGSLTFVNNRLVGKTAISAALAAQGVIVTTLGEALQKHGDILKQHFMAQTQRLGSEKFASLHTAFVADGAFIYVPRGVELPHPILVVHGVRGDAAAVFPHTLVIAEDRATACVVDFFTALEDASPLSRLIGKIEGAAPAATRDGLRALVGAGSPALAVGASDLYAGHGAKLTYVSVQNWTRETLAFQFNSKIVRRDAHAQSVSLHLGGRQARYESHSQLQAPGASSEMLALTVANGAQEFDQRTLQIHQAPNTTSNLLYKNALLDTARTIFSGLIIVDPDAQKTNAYQSNRNLMLSDGAEANSLPGLEILANDVRCTHGATTSRIDPEQQFYLQARGIKPAVAHELLIAAFFEDVLKRLDHEKLHAALARLIQAKLEG